MVDAREAFAIVPVTSSLRYSLHTFNYNLRSCTSREQRPQHIQRAPATTLSFLPQIPADI